MRGQAAKVLSGADVRHALAVAMRGRYPTRNRVILLLSVQAGLRACEIARLTWRMVTDARGHIAKVLELPDKAAKKGSGRRVPLSPDLEHALASLRSAAPADAEVVIVSERHRAMTAKSLVNWFAAVYRKAGLQGCSSHSGRRTFVTRAARLIHKAGGSLRDVQELAGHRSIKTTQTYIEGDRDAQRRLIRML